MVRGERGKDGGRDEGGWESVGVASDGLVSHSGSAESLSHSFRRLLFTPAYVSLSLACVCLCLCHTHNQELWGTHQQWNRRGSTSRASKPGMCERLAPTRALGVCDVHVETSQRIFTGLADLPRTRVHGMGPGMPLTYAQEQACAMHARHRSFPCERDGDSRVAAQAQPWRRTRRVTQHDV